MHVPPPPARAPTLTSPRNELRTGHARVYEGGAGRGGTKMLSLHDTVVYGTVLEVPSLYRTI